MGVVFYRRLFKNEEERSIPPIDMQVPKRRSEESRRRESGAFFVTHEALERLQRLRVRLHGELPALIAEVERTKGFGDFSENAEYQDAKHTLRRRYGRLASIDDRLLRAEVIDHAGSPSGSIQLGSTVVLESGGKEQTYTILGPHETDPMRGRISHVSPLGALLLGRMAGDTVTLNTAIGARTYRIVSVR